MSSRTVALVLLLPVFIAIQVPAQSQNNTSGPMQFYENKDIARAAAIGETLSHFVELSNPKSEFFVLAFDNQPRALTD